MSSPIVGSDAVARGLLTRGELRWNYRAVYPDIYVRKGENRTLALNTRAAALWVSDGVITGRAAAALHGAKWQGPETPIELIGPSRRPRPGVIVRDERVTDDEIMTIGGLVVTTPERTALDLARHQPRLQALANLDALAAATRVQPKTVLALAERYRGARGVRRARELVPLVDSGAQSPKETWLRLLMIDAGLPRSATQIPVSNGFTTAFIDLGWEDVKIGMEYDGAQHATDRTQFVKDIGRHELFRAQDWLMVRVVKQHNRAFILRRVYDAFAFRGRWFTKSA